MSVLNQFRLLAEYNQLMNQRQYAAAASLSIEELNKDTGAFFKSVLGTLNHILVGDMIWLKRFAAHSSSADVLSYLLRIDIPKSLDALLFTEFSDLQAEREKVDQIIVTWVNSLSEEVVKSCIEYQNMAGKAFHKPLASLMNHLFLHQVHHRGQVTTLLSQFGVDFGETDLVEIIDECSA